MSYKSMISKAAAETKSMSSMATKTYEFKLNEMSTPAPLNEFESSTNRIPLSPNVVINVLYTAEAPVIQDWLEKNILGKTRAVGFDVEMR